jgi:phage tail tube protein FII
MRNKISTLVASLGLLVVLSGVASAAMVTLPTEPGVTFTATVAEQCNITDLPSAIGFNVLDHTIATNSAAQTVTLDNIVLLDTKKLKISIKASAASFTAAAGAGTSYTAGNVTWNDGGTWTNGTGATGTLATSYNEVVTSDANAASLSTTGLVFTLAARDDIDRAGNYTLAATWKLESSL